MTTFGGPILPRQASPVKLNRRSARVHQGCRLAIACIGGRGDNARVPFESRWSIAGSGTPFSEDDLRAAADSRSWRRGLDYHARGLVYSLLEDGEYVASIRAAYKRKRNFIKLLDRVSKHARRAETRK